MLRLMAEMKESTTKAKVLIVDDHPTIREAMTAFIDGEPDLMVCGAVPRASAGLEAIAALCPDVVITGIKMTGEDGIAFVRKVHARWPGLAVLVCSMGDENVYAQQALKAGARGYLMKHQAVSELPGALRQVLVGRVYLSTRIARKMHEGS